MTITERDPDDQLELESGEDAKPDLGVFERPKPSTGWRSWITTVDHKKVGVLYGGAALFFFLVGGIEALAIRTQLFTPNGEVLSAEAYNQAFTMHATTMVFLVIMPMAAAFANYLIPLQIGARDVAFPRLNAFGVWTFIFGGIFLNLSWFVGGGAPNGGWFAYAPNTGLAFSPTDGMTFWALGLQITGIASLTSAINLIVTMINMRAPGMTLMRMPVFTWMILVVQFLLLFAIPIISIALFLLTFDRLFGANFFNPDQGADPLLWQHLFWIFGHPEVYILILPSFGIVSDTLPVFSRKPLFGYEFVVFSGVAIGFMGWGVWAHHMFVSGIGPVSVAAFSVTTMFIAVPTGVKILNWMATMWGGKIRFTVPMMFSVSLVGMFTVGGLSGVMHAVAPSDSQQTDTYFIVAHFHYVLFGGAMMGIFAGLYYWWPKVFGYMLNEGLGRANFWLMLVGFNLTFGPMHILGLQGMPRRTYRYDNDLGFDLWNKVATVGSFILALGVLMFLINIARSRHNPNPGPDPWDARTLEWSIPSPTPEHNFDEIPVVEHLDDWWHRKYQPDETGKYVKVADAADIAQTGDAHPHLPSPSYWPIIAAMGLPLIAFGLITNLGISIVGAVLLGAGIFSWGFEPPDDPDASHDHAAHGEGNGGDDEEADDEEADDEEAESSDEAEDAGESEEVTVDG